jgi:hypothetical protein
LLAASIVDQFGAGDKAAARGPKGSGENKLDRDGANG